jgi:hypothetical protein
VKHEEVFHGLHQFMMNRSGYLAKVPNVHITRNFSIPVRPSGPWRTKV